VTLSIISVLSWGLFLLVEETEVHSENKRHAENHKVYLQIDVPSMPRHDLENEQHI
jgi:hypothetical protein